MSDLERLIEAVEAGTLCAGELCISEEDVALIEAALRLHEALLPGWAVENLGNACVDGTGGWNVRLVAPDYLETFMHSTGNAATPARAWLLSILRALQATTETGVE